MNRKSAFPLIIISIIFAFLLMMSSNMNSILSIHGVNSVLSKFQARLIENEIDPIFVESEISSTPPSDRSIPRLAYLISGSKGDLEQLWRTLHALYHPLNQYVVHLDLESSAVERLELATRVEREPIFSKVGNVHMNTRANMVTYRGPTMIANTLQSSGLLLNKSKEWDWFINLSASDYPLVTQEDILYAFSYLPRNLNFIEHTSRLGWKENERAKPLIVDPGLYMSKKTDIFWVTQRREVPTAFKLFTGSAWMVQSRAFVEYCVWGWDNLPRTILMYYTNFLSSPESYFQTVICNAPEFAQTAINHDLHYISWDVPPRQHPHTLGVKDMAKMIRSKAPFARKFNQSDPVLDMIDATLLGRRNGSFTPGGWCTGDPPCSGTRESYRLLPGPGALRLASLMDRMVRSGLYIQHQCK
ncbi:beta-glucuronosyltransferase GlcAT14A-like [Magnolia sinica]|uniref:beta-glucuronosyltransferase GlcAT14A-like n=1 Tax=Magnolia sinica TaxID=86752 RepID=UPI00265ABBE9|nr:beta-glucuronosyltransferase GlcAT14A-like [Magnolia sinica]